MIKVNSTEKNIEGLESYLANGYVEADSFNDPEDDALECLSDLLVKDEVCCLLFCKKILNSHNIDGVFIRGSALNFLLLSEQWSYAFEYLKGNADNLTIAEIEKALFYFYCARNETDPYPVPEGLFKKLMGRYKELKDDPDAKFYHLHETYNDFSKAYSLSNKKKIILSGGFFIYQSVVENNWLSVEDADRKAVLKSKERAGTITADEENKLSTINQTDKALTRRLKPFVLMEIKAVRPVGRWLARLRKR